MYLILTMMNSIPLFLFGKLLAELFTYVQGDEDCTDTMGKTIHCKEGTYCCMGASFCCTYDKKDGFDWRIPVGIVGGFMFLIALLSVCRAYAKRNRRTAYVRLPGPTVVVNQQPVATVHPPPPAIYQHPTYGR